MREIRKLVIVSHVVHYRHHGALYAYGPYAREIDIWADLFPAVEIAAPCRTEVPPGDSLPFTRANITITPQWEQGGETRAAKLSQLLALPAMTMTLARALWGADAIHVRCPGNLGLLGVVLAPLFSRRLVAKYAGQWNGYAGEPLAARLQRRILASRWWSGPVTVYGRWPRQPAHVISFFTSMMSGDQLQRAERIAGDKQIGAPLKMAYVGALSERKRVAALVDAVKIARDEGVALQLTIVGDGPERQALERQVGASHLTSSTTFTGALPFDAALRWYEWADCLVLPSRHSEGWPKAVAEAMSFGLVCIAVDHGQLREMLDGRGILLPSGDAQEIAQAIVDVARRPDLHRARAQAASRWAMQFSLEGLRSALAQLLTTHWDAPISVSGLAISSSRPEQVR